jgi:hypothetical protein
MNTYLKDRINIVVKNNSNNNYNITEVTKLLGLKPLDNYSGNCKQIYNYLLKFRDYSKELYYFLNNIDSSSSQFCRILTNSIYDLFYPENFHKSPIGISGKNIKS